MKSRILTGILAAAMTMAIPWVLLGMTSTPEALPETREEPENQERRIQEIVVHESEKRFVDEDILVMVELDGEARELCLKEYLLGVLMGEMPGAFPLEALKAQAVAARTFTLRRVEQGGLLSDDPAVCQAYADPAGARGKWGENWEAYLEKMKEAVESTDGQVLTYEGKLISATYFSCSGGKTESAQAVWGGDVPYLVSVDSPGEEDGAAYDSQVSVPLEEFLSRLEIEKPAVSAVTYTEGGGVDTVTLDGKTVDGTEFRSLFGLRSTMFIMEITETSVDFTVRGFGHRVGMSQYGAKAMAEAGKSYEEILTWYYTGVELVNYEADG